MTPKQTDLQHLRTLKYPFTSHYLGIFLFLFKIESLTLLSEKTNWLHLIQFINLKSAAFCGWYWSFVVYFDSHILLLSQVSLQHQLWIHPPLKIVPNKLVPPVCLTVSCCFRELLNLFEHEATYLSSVRRVSRISWVVVSLWTSCFRTLSSAKFLMRLFRGQRGGGREWSGLQKPGPLSRFTSLMTKKGFLWSGRVGVR